MHILLLLLLLVYNRELDYSEHMFNSALSCVGYRRGNVCEIYSGNCHSDPHHHRMIQNAWILLSDPDQLWKEVEKHSFVWVKLHPCGFSSWFSPKPSQSSILQEVLRWKSKRILKSHKSKGYSKVMLRRSQDE